MCRFECILYNAKNFSQSGKMFEIKITKKRVKYARMRIKDSKTLLVSVPFYYSKVQCEDFIAQNDVWIRTTLQKFKHIESTRLAERESRKNTILYFGQWVQKDWLTTHFNKQLLQNELRDLLLEQCQRLSNIMNLPYKHITLTQAKSYFGICTSDDSLRFSTMLLFAPKSCIEYVVIHELAHIMHKNHSKAFWGLVEKYCAEFRSRRAFLRQNGQIYKEMLQEFHTLFS